MGIPMRVVDAWTGGALVQGRGRCEPVDTRLVDGGDTIAAGDWLLVHQGAARERIDAARAAEIDATLDLVAAALGGDTAGAQADAGFVLPSSLDAASLAALTGVPR